MRFNCPVDFRAKSPKMIIYQELDHLIVSYPGSAGLFYLAPAHSTLRMLILDEMPVCSRLRSARARVTSRLCPDRVIGLLIRVMASRLRVKRQQPPHPTALSLQKLPHQLAPPAAGKGYDLGAAPRGVVWRRNQ
jgi:hypothetical protein